MHRTSAASGRKQTCSAVYLGPGSSASPVSWLRVVECIIRVNGIIVGDMASHFRCPSSAKPAPCLT